jgi:hypothetical protein
MAAAAAAAAPQLCFQWAQRGACAFEDRCHFAHGAADDVTTRRAVAGATPQAPGAPQPGSRAARLAAAGADGVGAGSSGADGADGSAAAPPPPPARVVLFVAGMPPCLAGSAVKKPLQRAFRPFHPTAGALPRSASAAHRTP